jgi:hypothetical protein
VLASPLGTVPSQSPDNSNNAGSIASSIALSSNATLFSHSFPHQHQHQHQHSQHRIQSNTASSHHHSSQIQLPQSSSSSASQSHQPSTSWFHQGTSTAGSVSSHSNTSTNTNPLTTSTATPSKSSSSSMIVSASSFYDPAHASALPQYQNISVWDAAFDPSFSATAGGEAFYTSNTHAQPHTFPAGTGAGGTGTTSGGSAFHFVQSRDAFGFHRTSPSSQQGQGHQQQQRPIVPAPRKIQGVRHYNQSDGQQAQAQAQTQGQGQGQVSLSSFRFSWLSRPPCLCVGF